MTPMVPTAAWDYRYPPTVMGAVDGESREYAYAHKGKIGYRLVDGNYEAIWVTLRWALNYDREIHDLLVRGRRPRIRIAPVLD